jgi:hypothetical protein
MRGRVGALERRAHVITPLPIVRTRAGARHVSPHARRPVAASMRRGMWVRRGSVAGRRHCRCPRRGRAHGATHAYVGVGARDPVKPGCAARGADQAKLGREEASSRAAAAFLSERTITYFVLVQLGMPAACIHIDRYMPLRTNHSFMLV